MALASREVRRIEILLRGIVESPDDQTVDRRSGTRNASRIAQHDHRRRHRFITEVGETIGVARRAEESGKRVRQRIGNRQAVAREIDRPRPHAVGVPEAERG